VRIESAIYKNHEGIEQLINLNEIVSRPDYDVVRKNLHCAYPGCPARIEYVPKGLKIAFFRTWRNNDHSEDCEDYFVREKKKAALKNSATDTAKLTDTHIKDILKGMNKSINESLEQKELRLKKQREYANKKRNSTTDLNRDPTNMNIGRPTTDKEAEYQAEGTKAPRVRRRYNPNDINEADIGTATGIAGTIVRMQLFEKRSIIALKKNNGYFNIYLEEDFFSDAALNIDTILKVLKDTIQNNEDYTLLCVGNIENRDNSLCMVVNNQNHIRINAHSMGSFIFSTNNSKSLLS